MIVTDKLKRIIFKRLYEELGDCDIILHNKNIFFINREKKYWYFELDENGVLWWRYHFFTSFFKLFSMSPDDFTPLLSSWVEEVLNCKVVTTFLPLFSHYSMVEEVLNCKVVTTCSYLLHRASVVEEVLNCKVVTTYSNKLANRNLVEEVLNCKVVTTIEHNFILLLLVEEVLNQ